MTRRAASLPALSLCCLFPWMVAAPGARAESLGSFRMVFVTSVTGTGDLGSWPDAGGTVGIAAGDAICQTRAAAAGLANPSNFVAWLSDMSDDAYCRVHNLSGTKASNCGQPSLPVAAGPWLRTDGFPFSEAIDLLLLPDGVTYSALQFDEFGNAIPAFAAFFTATDANGVLDVGGGTTTCGDWTSTAGFVQIGAEQRTTFSWTDFGSGSCAAMSHLICLETLAGPALPAFAVPGRQAFVTSVTGNGELGSWPDAGGNVGIAAGDAICQARAIAGGLGNPSSFKAWLSDALDDAIDRFVHDGPWVRPDGVLVAANKADLTDGELFAPINVTEAGTYLGNWIVWTGTSNLGEATGIDCDDWTVGVGGTDGSRGTANDLRSWTAPSQTGCDFTSVRLYCLSDLELEIFSDGFESGDTSAWSGQVP